MGEVSDEFREHLRLRVSSQLRARRILEVVSFAAIVGGGRGLDLSNLDPPSPSPSQPQPQPKTQTSGDVERLRRAEEKRARKAARMTRERSR